MITNKTLKEYGFNSMFDYFTYIVDSKINGQERQVIELIKAMSKEQKKMFLGFDSVGVNRKDIGFCKEMTIAYI